MVVIEPASRRTRSGGPLPLELEGRFGGVRPRKARYPAVKREADSEIDEGEGILGLHLLDMQGGQGCGGYCTVWLVDQGSTFCLRRLCCLHMNNTTMFISDCHIAHGLRLNRGSKNKNCPYIENDGSRNS